MPNTELASGDVALAYGACAAGVGLVTGYPGSPSSGTVDALLEMPEASAMQITWAINECIALEMAYGASIAGRRALLCVKSVGLNIALDPLMTMVLTGCKAGLVILLGDDPGGWASQNEQDTRLLAILADIPLLEPATPQEAQDTLIEAFDLSERHGLPVIVRETRALALAEGPVERRPARATVNTPYAREPKRWISLPENVVENHRRLRCKMEALQQELESSALNRIAGDGRLGVVACGSTGLKLRQALGPERLSHFCVLSLGTFHPLPAGLVTRYLARVDTALVFEENEGYIEQKLAALAHEAGLGTRLLGRGSGHLPVGGELDAAQIVSAVVRLKPEWAGELGAPAVGTRAMPSQKPLCPDCPYRPLFEALLECIDEAGGRERTIIVGEPGCMVRACYPPYELLDVKYSLGASLGLAVGLATSHPGPKVVALTGDSSFLHHGWGGLVEAARSRADLLAIVLDNSTTALSGRQPHAGTAYDARQQSATALDLAELARAVAPGVQTIDPLDREATRLALRRALGRSGLDVLIARSPCPRMPLG